MESFTVAPSTLGATRVSLHRLAAYVVAPVRYRATGRFGLRSTLGGFGTPAFDGRTISVVGSELVDSNDGFERRHQITSLQAAADFLGDPIDPETAAEHDSPGLGDVDERLPIDVEASRFLGSWFEMAFTALELVRADAASVEASDVQLWPGHFDAAIELGVEDHRASYGASPGDHSTDDPYLYVSIWVPDQIGIDRNDTLWNASDFVGSMLRFSEFPDGDPVAAAAEFWRTSRDALS